MFLLPLNGPLAGFDIWLITRSIHVYEVGPLPDHPTFRQLAKVQCSTWAAGTTSPQIFSLCGDKLIFAAMEKIAVWDFIAGRCVWWSTPDPELREFDTEKLRIVSQYPFPPSSLAQTPLSHL